MEELTLPGDLWNELSERSVSTPTPEVKTNVMPAIFSGRQTIEKFRDAVVSGFLPLALYIALFTSFGLNLGPHEGPIQIACLPLSFALAYLIFPLFDFTNLRRGRDIVPLFALGLLISTIMGFAEATLNPNAYRFSFLEQALGSGLTLLQLTLSTPLFLMSILAFWAFKAWTLIVLRETPWYDKPSYRPARLLLATGLLLTPPALYSGLYLSARPSQRVIEWQAPLTTNTSTNPWLPRFSAENNERWSELSLQGQEDYISGALDLLRQGQLPTLDSYEISRIFSEERIGENPSHNIELRMWEMMVGFARGQHPAFNDGNDSLGLGLARGEFSEGELQELEKRLVEGKEELPSQEQFIDNFLLGNLSQRSRQFGEFSLYSWLDQRQATPRKLLKRRWIHDRIESWLKIKPQLTQTPDYKAETSAFSSSVAKLCYSGPPHNAGPLVLPHEYSIGLDLLLWATKARLYQKEHGQLPTNRVQLAGLPLDWELHKDFDDAVYLVYKNQNYRMRMSK